MMCDHRETALAIYAGLVLLAIVLTVSGCAHRAVEYGGARYTSTTLGSNTTVGDLEISISPDGTKRVTVTGFGSEQTEGLRALAEGAVQGAIKAVAPVP